jgi:hypothetical protein
MFYMSICKVRLGGRVVHISIKKLSLLEYGGAEARIRIDAILYEIMDTQDSQHWEEACPLVIVGLKIGQQVLKKKDRGGTWRPGIANQKNGLHGARKRFCD